MKSELTDWRKVAGSLAIYNQVPYASLSVSPFHIFPDFRKRSNYPEFNNLHVPGIVLSPNSAMDAYCAIQNTIKEEWRKGSLSPNGAVSSSTIQAETRFSTHSEDLDVFGPTEARGIQPELVAHPTKPSSALEPARPIHLRLCKQHSL